jgi:hypothetical protein
MMTHRAKVARRKGHGLQTQGKIVIKNSDKRRQLRLKNERTSERFDRKAFGLEFVKRATGISSGLRKARDWTVRRGRPPPKRKNLLALIGYEKPEL